MSDNEPEVQSEEPSDETVNQSISRQFRSKSGLDTPEEPDEHDPATDGVGVPLKSED
jgi:hypothetical protein